MAPIDVVQGMLRITLYGTIASITENSVAKVMPSAAVWRRTVPMAALVLALKAIRTWGSGCTLIVSIPIRSKVLRGMRLTELPVSITTLDTSQWPIPTSTTRGSLCGRWMPTVSSAENEISAFG